MGDKEFWLPSPSLPEYEVSSWGRVMRVPYQSLMPNGGVRWYGGTPHYGQSHASDPRPLFVFRKKSYRISKLICEAFHGPKPYLNSVVMHIDDDCTNNSANNLKWGTQKENLNTAGFIEYCRSRTGENNPFIKGKKKLASIHA